MKKGACKALVTAQPFCSILFTNPRIVAAYRESDVESLFTGLRFVISFNSSSINFL